LYIARNLLYLATGVVGHLTCIVGTEVIGGGIERFGRLWR
jgi:hypothetical protein